MERGLKLNFRKEVLNALQKGIINSVEAKECLIRGVGNEELPLFFDFEENDTFKASIEALEKMEIIEPLIRLDESF
jgi:hypothetical protein